MESSRILVFGATGAIGTALSRLLVAGGAQVLLAGRNRDRLEALAEELGMPHGVVEAGDASTIEQCFVQIGERWGGVDGVANCMGSVLLKPAHTTSDTEWQQVLTTNLFSAFAIVRAAARTMRQTGGSVAFVSTAAARIGLANHEAIAAAKAGIEGLVRSAAATYASSSIRFNAVAPGLVKSEMTRRLWESPPSAEASTQMHALGRLGEPEDVARALFFLLDPHNNWITGQILGVDGGLGTILPRRRA
ncbi:MAG: SDR family oxidoreductase [Planctomycetes bacterium]|nr:SDR family oxidoreductase [Planctomycetota bacterium]